MRSAHCTRSTLPPARAPFALSTEACRGAQDRPQLDDGPPRASSRRRLAEAFHFFRCVGSRRPFHAAPLRVYAVRAVSVRKPPRLSAQHVVVRAMCTRPACSAGRAHAACLVHCAGSRSATLWGLAKVLAAKDTWSSSCTRLTMPLCLLLSSVRVVCAHVRRDRVGYRVHV